MRNIRYIDMYFLTFTPSPPRNSRGGDVFYHLCLLEQWGDALWVKAGNAATDGCYQELLLGMLTPLFSYHLRYCFNCLQIYSFLRRKGLLCPILLLFNIIRFKFRKCFRRKNRGYPIEELRTYR